MSCYVFVVYYSNGFFLKHEMKSDYVLVNKLFCYIITKVWGEGRLFYHSAFQQVGPVSSSISAYCNEGSSHSLYQSCAFYLVLLYEQYNCSVMSRRRHDMTSVVLALWRHLHVLLQIDCFLSHRHPHTEPHSIAGFICPPWVLTDLAVAFCCVLKFV
jgi:hypothetical protein